MCSKTVDSVIRVRSCVQNLRARAVPDALNTETQSNGGTLKITRARWPLGREDACVFTVTKEPCGCSAERRRRGADVDSLWVEKKRPTNSCVLRGRELNETPSVSVER